MHLAITFRNFDASEALKDHTRERLERLRRNLDRACTAHVVLNLERHLHHADLTFITGRWCCGRRLDARTCTPRSTSRWTASRSSSGGTRTATSTTTGRPGFTTSRGTLRRGGEITARRTRPRPGSLRPVLASQLEASCPLPPGGGVSDRASPHLVAGVGGGPRHARMKITEFLSPQAVIPELQGAEPSRTCCGSCSESHRPPPTRRFNAGRVFEVLVRAGKAEHHRHR